MTKKGSAYDTKTMERGRGQRRRAERQTIHTEKKKKINESCIVARKV